MDGAVGAAGPRSARVVLGPGAPERVAGVLVQQPELPAQKALAPIGPGFAGEIPAAAGGVHREAVGMGFDQALELASGEIEEMGNLSRGWHGTPLMVEIRQL